MFRMETGVRMELAALVSRLASLPQLPPAALEELVDLVPSAVAARDDLSSELWSSLYERATALVSDRGPANGVPPLLSSSRFREAEIVRSLLVSRDLGPEQFSQTLTDSVESSTPVLDVYSLWSMCARNPALLSQQWELVADALSNPAVLGDAATAGTLGGWVVSPEVPIGIRRTLAKKLTLPDRIAFVLGHPSTVDDDVELLSAPPLKAPGPGTRARLSLLAAQRPELVEPFLSALMSDIGPDTGDATVTFVVVIALTLRLYDTAPHLLSEIEHLCTTRPDRRWESFALWLDLPSVLSDPLLASSTVSAFCRSLHVESDPWTTRSDGSAADLHRWPSAAVQMLDHCDRPPWPALFSMADRCDDVANVLVEHTSQFAVGTTSLREWLDLRAGIPPKVSVGTRFGVFSTKDVPRPEPVDADVVDGLEPLVDVCGTDSARWRLAVSLLVGGTGERVPTISDVAELTAATFG